MFNPKTWALDGNWSWLKINRVAEDGLSAEEASSLVAIHGLYAPYRMVKWCEHQLMGTCSLAGWSWDIEVEEHRKK